MAKVPKSMFQVPLVGFFSGKDEVLCTLEHRPLLKLRSGGCTGRACNELCLLLPTQISWQVGRGEKKGMCAPSSLLDLRDQGSQPSTFPQKRGQEKKSNAFRESLQGEHEENKMFCMF